MIEKRINKAGKAYYYNTERGKFASKNDFARSLGVLEYEELLDRGELTKGQKIAFKASQRLRINGKFINKREEGFIKDVLNNKGIKIEGNELTNLLPEEYLSDLRQKRSKIVEKTRVYSKGWSKAQKKRIEIFDIFKEIASSKKQGRKFKVNGEEVSTSEAIKLVSEFIADNTEGGTVPPLFIWHLNFESDGDYLDIDLEETEVIKSTK